MTGLTVKALTDADEPDLFGKDPSDLQSNIVIGEDSISGTLKYIEDYSSAFGGDLAHGNYIALHAEVPDVEDVTITVKVTNESTLDEDGNMVLRIADKDTQTITITASKDGYKDVVKEYALDELVCQSEVVGNGG